MIDIASYRNLKSLPIDSIYGEVIRNFCDKDNLRLWSFELLDQNNTSKKSSNYQDFVKTMSNLAQSYADKNCGVDPSCQFASLDLEFVLNEKRVKPIINMLLEDMTEGDRRRLVTTFLKEGVELAQQSRKIIQSKQDLPF